MGWWLLRLSAKIWALLRLSVASHAGIFRGARFSSFVGRNEKRAPLKTPAWEARLSVNLFQLRLTKKFLKINFFCFKALNINKPVFFVSLSKIKVLGLSRYEINYSFEKF